MLWKNAMASVIVGGLGILLYPGDAAACWWCKSYDGEYGYIHIDNGEEYVEVSGGSPHTGYGTHACLIPHPDFCWPEDDVDQLEAALEVAAASGDASEIYRMQASYAAVYVNVPRAAIQVADCQGRIIRHYPIAGELMAELMAHADTRPQ